MSGIRKEWYDRQGRRHVKIMDDKGIWHLIDPDPSEISEPPEQKGGNHPTKNWHETAMGKIGIGITITILAAAAILAIRHYLPSLGF
jgi:hypothetical protein